MFRLPAYNAFVMVNDYRLTYMNEHVNVIRRVLMSETEPQNQIIKKIRVIFEEHLRLQHRGDSDFIKSSAILKRLDGFKAYFEFNQLPFLNVAWGFDESGRPVGLVTLIKEP